MERYKYIRDDPVLSESLIDKEYLNSLLRSKIKIKWICLRCDNIWFESIAARKKYINCPICQERRCTKYCAKCNKIANFNFRQYDWGKYCSEHREKDMIRIKTTNEVKNGFCDGICKNRIHVGSGHYVCEHNNLTILYPELMNEWDFESNELDPTKLKTGSGKKAHWKCRYGHSWLATIRDRAKNGTSCPKCL